jgi:hypothetical protein
VQAQVLQYRSHSPPAFTYAKTRRLPPHLTQANTSKSNVLFSNSAQSTRGVLSFIRSFLAAASLPALASSAWGTRNGRSLAPGTFDFPNGGHKVLPFVDVFHLRNKKIYDYRIYIDPTPLLGG